MNATSVIHTSFTDTKALLAGFSLLTRTLLRQSKSVPCGQSTVSEGCGRCRTLQRGCPSTRKTQRSPAGKKARSCTSRSET